MANILFVDDNIEVRQLVQRYLEEEGHRVVPADNGRQAQRIAPEMRPDLIVTDIMMPKLDGFGFFEAVRADPKTAKTPVIFLTALNNPETLRKALKAGVDDFISKPFERAELIRVITQQLATTPGGKAGGDPWALNAQTRGAPVSKPAPPASSLTTLTTTLTGVPATAASPGATDPALRFSLSDTELLPITRATSRWDVNGTVLFCDVRNFQTFRASLNGVEVVEVLTQFFSNARAVVEQQKGWAVKFLGDGFVALFEDAAGAAESQTVRALKSALLIVLVAQRLKSWLRTRFPDRALPDFTVGLGVHAGHVAVGTLSVEAGAGFTIASATVHQALRLEQMTKTLGWSIVASQTAFEDAAEILDLGRGALTPTPGSGGDLLVAEVRGPLPRAAKSQEQLKIFSLIEAAVEANTAAIVARRPG